jgi:hypothetical protein
MYVTMAGDAVCHCSQLTIAFRDDTLKDKRPVVTPPNSLAWLSLA